MEACVQSDLRVPERTSGNPPVVVFNLLVACRGVFPLPDSIVTHRCVPG
jgi:hypothetical protein